MAKIKLDEKGARGHGYGELGEMDFEHLTPEFNRRRQRGREIAVGMYGTADHPGVVNKKGDL